MKKLTRVEEDIMHIIWQLERCTVSQIIDQMGEPKPPHSTVSTTVRIMERKGYLDHKAYGRTYEYFPLLDKEAYRKSSVMELVKGYFGGSVNQLVSFLAQEEKIDPKEIKELINKLDNPEK